MLQSQRLSALRRVVLSAKRPCFISICYRSSIPVTGCGHLLYLSLVLVWNTRKLLNAGRPVRAVDLLHRGRLVQSLFVVDGTSLDDFHAFKGLGIDVHDGTAGRTVVVGNILSGVSFACEDAIDTRELLVLSHSQSALARTDLR